MTTTNGSDEEVFVWRITKPESGPVHVEAGPQLADHEPNAYLPMIGQVLIQLGTKLMKSRVRDGDEDFEDEGGDDDDI